MENQYVIVGLDAEANNHIATVLLDRKISDGNPEHGYIRDDNVTILYNLDENVALMDDNSKHVLLVVTKDRIGEYVDFFISKGFLQNKFKLVLFNGNEGTRKLPKMQKLEEMCTAVCIEVDERSRIADTRTRIEKAVSGKQRQQGPRPKPETTTRKPSSTGSGVPIHVAIIGGPGTGKSKLGNLILQDEAFLADMYKSKSTTKISSEIRGKIIVYDVPSSNEKRNYKDIKERLTLNEHKNVILLYTLKFGTRMTKEQTDRVDLVKKTFGEKFLSEHLCLAVTFGDEFELLKRQRQIQDFPTYMDSDEGLRSCDLLRLCQGRHCLVNNVAETVKAEEDNRQEVMDVIHAAL